MKQEEVDAFLEANADPAYRTFNSRIIPDAGRMAGVRMPLLRKFAGKIMKDDWRSFLELEPHYYEQKVLKALVIAEAEISGRERVRLTEEFSREIADWGTCDTLCGSWKIDSESSAEMLWDMSLRMLKTGREFMMRVGAVMMLFHFIDDEHIAQVIEQMRRISSPGYYCSMGAGWCLSFCYIAYPEMTEKALVSGCADLEVLRLAVRKIRESHAVSTEDKTRLREALALQLQTPRNTR
ncbi:MAG: DNA alkylation repair protein [Candidatus Methanomethylophilus sp.]|nr:DNA alkylation repair protein [Methanomethylophilus sp.]MCI2093473.1 DNA alkylation repair protein [Methanomethylophilus sp.]